MSATNKPNQDSFKRRGTIRKTANPPLNRLIIDGMPDEHDPLLREIDIMPKSVKNRPDQK
jgi:hypothetical protein